MREHLSLYIETNMLMENCGYVKLSFSDISFSFNYGFARDVKLMGQYVFLKIRSNSYGYDITRSLFIKITLKSYSTNCNTKRYSE